MAFDSILVAIDGSECSERAYAKPLELAVLTGARLTALAVEGPLPAYAATIAARSGRRWTSAWTSRSCCALYMPPR